MKTHTFNSFLKYIIDAVLSCVNFTDISLIIGEAHIYKNLCIIYSQNPRTQNLVLERANQKILLIYLRE